MNKPIDFYKREQVIPVDQWIMGEEDKLIKTTKGFIIIPVKELFGINDEQFNYFTVSPKRCYNSVDIREHIVQYVNYFEKFYDTDKELITIYGRLKYLIDYEAGYTKYHLFNDIYRYILNSSIRFKISCMNRDNYYLDLSKTIKKNSKDNLKYNNAHGMILMEISLIYNIIIPLLTHYIYIHNIGNVNDFLLEIYDKILDLYSVDIYNKLYETSISNTEQHRKSHIIWEKQDIRGINTTTHSMDSVNNIIINIIPKYLYNGNMVTYNYKSIIRNMKYQITGRQSVVF